MIIHSLLNHPIGEDFAHNLPYILKMADVLKEQKFDKLGLVCTGSSGAIIATVIAQQLTPIPKIIYLRKSGESGHSHFLQDHLAKVEDLVIVDDFVCTGSTCSKIRLELIDLGRESVRGLCLSGSANVEELRDRDFFGELFVPPSI